MSNIHRPDPALDPDLDLDECEHPPEYLHSERRVGKRPFVICDLCHATVVGKAGDPLISELGRCKRT